jgi:hypothetical protein
MKDFVLDIMLVILKVLIALLTIPTMIALIAVFFAALVIVGIGAILISPIWLACWIKTKLTTK